MSDARPPSEDTAELCSEHKCCIRGFVTSAQTGEAGWWHMHWNAELRIWQLSGPHPVIFPGSHREATVSVGSGEAEPAALIPYVGLKVVWDITEKGLFPPC